MLNKRSGVNKERGRKRERENRLLLLSDGNTAHIHTHCCPGGRVRCVSVYSYVSVTGVLASPNTSAPCPFVVLIIHWTVNIGALPSDALFMCSFSTGSESWPFIADITVMSTRQTH